jgi:hypothetical protein
MTVNDYKAHLSGEFFFCYIRQKHIFSVLLNETLKLNINQLGVSEE